MRLIYLNLFSVHRKFPYLIILVSLPFLKVKLHIAFTMLNDFYIFVEAFIFLLEN